MRERGSVHDLSSLLTRLDGKGYKAYKEIEGLWRYRGFLLRVDHVQGDPFAAPSRVTALVDRHFAGLPDASFRTSSRAVGCACLLARRFQSEARQTRPVRGTGKSGEIRMEAPGQEVLPQTAVQVASDGSVEARFTVGLPALGRRILGREAARLLGTEVPRVVEKSLRAPAYDEGEILRHAEVNEDADALRALLPGLGLVAFVADGAVLPRRSGVSQEPLSGDAAVPFLSPDRLRVTVDLPNVGRVSGMGVPRGVTLLVGGGYHGKSTLLRALERGVYNHRPGDGREFVVSDSATVKIRAEDGRAVQRVDISPFIRELPSGEDTRRFSTPNASGSTSQAANIIEALEVGARVLLVDEDTAATNFMIRDRRMQALIPRPNEPIVPFVDRVRSLYEELGVSSILVLGGSGDYLDVADTVVALKEYRPQEVTEEARRVAAAHPTGRLSESPGPLRPPPARVPLPDSLDPRRGRREGEAKARGVHSLSFGREEVDLSSVEQIVSWAQAQALARGLLLARKRWIDGKRSLAEVLGKLEEQLDREGLDALDRRRPGDLAAFRRFELAAALNRIRTLRVK